MIKFIKLIKLIITLFKAFKDRRSVLIAYSSPPKDEPIDYYNRYVINFGLDDPISVSISRAIWRFHVRKGIELSKMQIAGELVDAVKRAKLPHDNFNTYVYIFDQLTGKLICLEKVNGSEDPTDYIPVKQEYIK